MPNSTTVASHAATCGQQKRSFPLKRGLEGEAGFHVPHTGDMSEFVGQEAWEKTSAWHKVVN